MISELILKLLFVVRSFVRSITMDSWSEKQIKMMRLGGNKRMVDWFDKHNIPKSTSIQQKYNTPAAQLYRLRLKAIAEGRDPPTELPKQASAPSHASNAGGN